MKFFRLSVLTLLAAALTGSLSAQVNAQPAVKTVEPARVPALDEIEADVRAAWTAERYAEIRKRAEDDMRARYTVVVPDLDPADLVDLSPPRPATMPLSELGQ